MFRQVNGNSSWAIDNVIRGPGGGYSLICVVAVCVAVAVCVKEGLRSVRRSPVER